MSEEHFDYVIVGGGVAGCILANRLSADPATRVLLLEAGGRDSSPLIRAPGGLLPIMMSGAHAWPYRHLKWLGLSEQGSATDKWIVCRLLLRTADLGRQAGRA